MKHVFTIHSHITFLAAIGTIIYENLPTEMVVLICGGGYEPKLKKDFRGEIVKSYDTLEASHSFISKLKNWNYTKSVNKYINQLIRGDDFIAYVDLLSVFNRYLVMHSRCKQFHIIEEGIVNYSDYDDFTLWTADLRNFQWQWKDFKDINQMFNACIRLLRGRSLRILALPIHPNLYTLHLGVNAYCFSKSAFQYTPDTKKRILDWNSLTTYISFDEVNVYENAWFWIGDVFCSISKVSLNDFERAIQELLKLINPKKEERVIYLKFKGSEREEEKKMTIKYLTQYNFKVELIPKNNVIELIFLLGNKLNVCGIRSSLLIYANLMGHSTYSIYPYLPEQYGKLLINYYSISKKVGFIS